MIAKSDRDPLDIVLRRTGALLKDIETLPGAPAMGDLAKQLVEFENRASATEVADQEARCGLFSQVCELRRRIAFSNPLLDYDKILFIKRHRSTFNHMCDQFYGTNAVPGGGLFVLSDPFGESPQLSDLLEHAVVESGRLACKPLMGGSFLSPELSWDGKSVFFAWVECTGNGGHIDHLDHAHNGHWERGRCYHNF
ncbi:MAG: hypothetical protein K9N23_00110 [Akkermansiaceae bacterium]|nr:hypothetical protein [Akkermansiaceae bacterium]MCF7730052.1 hypothetical protein [Akkermansiaceae bacterium]